MPIITVDHASASDIPIVRNLFREYEKGIGVDLGFQDFEAELAALPGDYDAPRGRLYLARADGEVVGCIALRPFEGDDCEMKRLYLRLAARGLGLGRTLAERVICNAKEIGYLRMLLDTLPSMTAARKLYVELGFQEIEPYRHNPIEGTSFMALEL